MIKISHYARRIIGAITVISLTACLPSQAIGQKSLKSAGLKVPKFGVEASEKTGVRTFAPETIQYSEEVIAKAQRILRKYDRDGSNFLEPQEISRGSWRGPEIYSHDKNGDRRLSLAELQDRYHQKNIIRLKEQQILIRQKEQQIQELQEEQAKSIISEGGGFRGKAGRQMIPSSEASDSNRFKQHVQTNDYVTQYIKRKDTNKNGMIDGDEMDKVRSRSKYDINDDGKIERYEMLAVLDKTSTGSSASKWKSSKTSNSRSRRSSSSFEKLDVNNDHLIQMHEFSKKWTAKKLDEFLAKDSNGDGVIAPDEW